MTADLGLQRLNPSELVDGPFVITYTAHLPFPIGIPTELGHALVLNAPYKDPSSTEYFRAAPFLRIRVFDTEERGLPMWQKGTHAAIEHFYGVRLHGDADQKYGEDELTAHDQWVTLETPHAAIQGEDPVEDPLFSFHRCLGFFNMFLQTVLLLTGDVRIRRISAHDLRPVVIIGALQQGQEWQMLTEMLMHPEAMPEGLLTTEKPFSQEDLNNGIYALITNKPYTNTAVWRSRAQRALRQTGDAADAIISFQVAAESMLFDTYRMLLVDEELSSAEIGRQLSEEIPFKTLLTRLLPAKLGGTWDVTREGTPIGQYWTRLYLMRNSIIHAGVQPHGGHAEAAQTAYWALRDQVEERLWAKHNVYPRTLYARLGKKQLAERGWLTASMLRILDDIEKGPQPYYWPYDRRTNASHGATVTESVHDGR